MKVWLRLDQWIWPTIAYCYACNNSSWLACLELTVNENQNKSILIHNITTFNRANVTMTIPSLHNFLIFRKETHSGTMLCTVVVNNLIIVEGELKPEISLLYMKVLTLIKAKSNVFLWYVQCCSCTRRSKTKILTTRAPPSWIEFDIVTSQRQTQSKMAAP